MSSVIAYLPIGADEKPISRSELCRLTGKSDRAVRVEINKLKNDVPVINVGLGYYIADDPDDPNLRAYILQEKHRIKEISKGLRKHKWLYKINKKQEILDI